MVPTRNDSSRRRKNHGTQEADLDGCHEEAGRLHPPCLWRNDPESLLEEKLRPTARRVRLLIHDFIGFFSQDVQRLVFHDYKDVAHLSRKYLKKTKPEEG